MLLITVHTSHRNVSSLSMCFLVLPFRLGATQDCVKRWPAQSLARMRKIMLLNTDRDLLDTEINPDDYSFLQKHIGAFKRMWEEQVGLWAEITTGCPHPARYAISYYELHLWAEVVEVSVVYLFLPHFVIWQQKDFWVRYVMTFRSYQVRYGCIRGQTGEYTFIIDQGFIYIHEQFLDGKNLMFFCVPPLLPHTPWWLFKNESSVGIALAHWRHQLMRSRAPLVAHGLIAKLSGQWPVRGWGVMGVLQCHICCLF